MALRTQVFKTGHGEDLRRFLGWMAGAWLILASSTRPLATTR